MTTGTSPICFECARLRGVTPPLGWVCEAYPEGIPTEILVHVHDHRMPFAGDHGLRFEPRAAGHHHQTHIHFGHVHVHLEEDTSEGAKRAWITRKGGAAVARKAAGKFSRPDYEILKEALAPNSEARRSWGAHVKAIGKTLPKLLASHLKEERENAVHAGKALKALATGNKPSSDEIRGLRNFGIRILMSGATMAVTGDPTGSIGHVASQLAQEIVNHVIAEHSLKLGTGTARLAIGRDQAPQDEIRLLQDFVEALAEAAESYQPSEGK